MENNYKIAVYVLVYGIIATIASFLFFDTTVAYSFVLGFATSMLNFSMMIKATRKSMLKPENKRTGYLITQSIFRFFIYGIILYISSIDGRFDLIPTFIGMLSIKIVYYMSLIFKKGV